MRSRSWPVFVSAWLLACSGGGTSVPPQPPDQSRGDEPAVAPGGDDPAAADRAPAAGDRGGLAQPNDPPGFEVPAWTAAGVGQEIAFGLEVVDTESDEIRVELVDKPASARVDPYTLTVVWKPTAADKPAGRFRVKLTEIQRDSGKTRVFEHRFSIHVTKARQPEPHAQPLDPAVEQLLTIHDPDRLAEINARWPLDKMLVHAAKLERDAIPEADRAKVAQPDGKLLYQSFLHGLAIAHDNPAVDPTSRSFDRAGFGSAKAWKLITVRPRLDKKWHELRLVYKAPAHADTYAMFRFRIVRDEETSEDARQFNNAAFSRLALDAFFTKDGTIHPKHTTDKRAHAKAVEKFVRNVLTFRDGEKPWARTRLLALPCEARLGGGSRRGDSGAYQSGDAWGWNVMKATAKDGQMRYGNVVIKGFATMVAPSADGKTWQMKCAPRFDPDADAHDPAMTGLCRDSGHVDMPGSGDGYRDHEVDGGKVVPALKDAVNMFVQHKAAHASAELPLRDPRRDLFEENGMTCSQCHVRQFGVRDFYDPSGVDPSAGAPTRANKKQATLYFVIVPTERWQAYAIDFQHKQECQARDAFAKHLGVTTSLGCPLMAETR